MPKNLVPILLSILGLAGLAASWSCLPPLQVGRQVIVLKPTPTPGPETPPPATPQTEPSPLPSPAPTIVPLIGRQYTVAQTGPTEATLVIDVVSSQDDTLGYTLTTTPKGASPMVRKGLTAKRVHDVYWVGEGASPVTKDISSYPVDLVSVGAGTFEAARVEAADGTTYYFAQTVEIKRIFAGGTGGLDLVSVK